MAAVPIVYSILSGVLYALSFPPSRLSPLAVLALGPLLTRLTDNSRQNFWRGFVCGWVANLMIFFWLWDTFKAADVSFAVTFSTWLALAAMMALYFGVFTLIYPFFPDNIWKPFLAAALWVVLEEIRSHTLTGFPWALFSHTQAYNIVLIQIAALTGAAGVSFVLVSANVALWVGNKNAKIAFGVLVLLVSGFGVWRLRRPLPIGDSAFLKVAILQGNIDQYQKWDDAYETDIRVQYETLAAVAASTKPDLIIWPESAVPGWYPNEERYELWVNKIVSKTKTFNLVGAVTKENGKPLNSAFLFAPDGRLIGRYDKRHLVPFGEYVPFGMFLKKWIPYLGQLGLFEAGENDNLLTMGMVPIAANICYEAIFPGMVRKSVNKGAELIVNITNDGWFLTTGAPEQHYMTNIFRAIENGRPVIRAANTGISAIIDAQGRQIARSKLMDRTVLEGSILLPPHPGTFYSKFGPWFSWLCAACVIIWLVYFWRRRTNERLSTTN